MFSVKPSWRALVGRDPISSRRLIGCVGSISVPNPNGQFNIGLGVDGVNM